MAKIGCFPLVLLQDPRFFDLSLLHQYLYVRMFFAADPWGRLPGSHRAVAQATWTELLLVDEAMPLFIAGDPPLVHQYEHEEGTSFQLHGYDRLQEKRFLTMRAQPTYPHPPADVWRDAGCRNISRASSRTTKEELFTAGTETDSAEKRRPLAGVATAQPQRGQPETLHAQHSSHSTKPSTPTDDMHGSDSMKRKDGIGAATGATEATAADVAHGDNDVLAQLTEVARCLSLES